MSGRYERVNTQDEDPDALSDHSPPRPQRLPNSPPPSFHSRASSADRRRQNVDSDLADAFDTDGDDSDDEPDDRQRLVRGNSFPVSQSTASAPTPASSTQSETTSYSSGQPSIQPQSLAAGHRAQPAPNSRIYGGGIQSDGVFSNMTARPERGEKIVEEAPPTYEQAAADAAPPYWETTIMAPGFGGPDDVYIDGMPVGSVFSFLWNGMISLSFQPLVGFLLTYLLHSTHAAKNGSRAGLGISIIQYGFYMKATPDDDGMGDGTGDGYAQPPDPNSHNFDPNAVGTGNSDDGSGWAGIESGEWIAYLLMIVGWFILIRAVSDYIRARRHEQLVLQSPDRGLGIPIIAEGERSETVV
ncbi:putative metal homeostatis protein bsd2 [Rosellinia necatrix]|uniref:Putative metal homeostatis protein bsd2 n=1 Tax=Rosellinia necatrix TaxID=77044 RepID=A0A1W2TXK5_ROSNE|nr:putative metal homeostatis protein bsd2 [Rosellinia necatrix]